MEQLVVELAELSAAEQLMVPCTEETEAGEGLLANLQVRGHVLGE